MVVVWGLWWSGDYMYVLAGQWYCGLGTGGRAVIWWSGAVIGVMCLVVWGLCGDLGVMCLVVWGLCGDLGVM